MATVERGRLGRWSAVAVAVALLAWVPVVAGGSAGAAVTGDPVKWFQTVLPGSVGSSEVSHVASAGTTVAVVGRLSGSVTFGTGAAARTVTGATATPYVARYAADGTFDWVQLLPAGTIVPASVAVAPDGGVLLVGRHGGTVTFTGSIGPSVSVTDPDSSGYNGYVARYSAVGEPEWATTIDGASGVDLSEIAVNAGAVVVGGTYTERVSLGPTGLDATGTAGVATAFVAWYQPDGVPLAVQPLTTPSAASEVGGLDLRDDGAVVLAGSVKGSATFGAGSPTAVTLPNPTGTDAFVAVYGADRVLQWADHTVGDGSTAAGDVAFTPGGGVVLAGTYKRTQTIGSAPGAPTVLDASIPGASYTFGFVGWFPAGGGVATATRIGGGTSGVDVAAVAAQPDGRTLVVGDFLGTADFGTTGPALTSQGGRNGYAARFGSDGSTDWVDGLVGAFSTLTGVAALTSGGVVVSGYENGTASLGPVGAATPIPASGSRTGLLAALSAAGVHNLSVAVSLDRADGESGGPVSGTVTVGNAGPNDASGVVVSLSAGFPLVAGTASQGVASSTLWTVGDLPAGGSATLAVSGALPATASCTSVTVDAIVSSPAGVDPVAADDTASAAVFVRTTVAPGGGVTFGEQAGRRGSQDAFGQVAVEADGTRLVAAAVDAGSTVGSGAHAVITSERTIGVTYAPDGSVGTLFTASGGFAKGQAIARTADGDVVIGGTLSGPATFGTGPGAVTLTHGASPLPDGFVARYAPDGQVRWAQLVGGGPGGASMVSAAAPVADGSVVVVGQYGAGGTFGAGGSAVAPSTSGADDGFVARYATDGTLAWVRTFGGAAMPCQYCINTEDIGDAVSLAPDGSILVSGRVTGDATFTDPIAPVAFTTRGYDDGFIARYTDAGSLVEVRQVGGPSSDRVVGVAAAADGSIVAAAWVGAGAWAGPSGAPVSPSSTGSALIRYASDGTVSRLDSIGGGLATGLAVASDGTAYVAGTTFEPATFGEGSAAVTLLPASSAPAPFGVPVDGWVAAYEPGAFGWVQQIGGPSSVNFWFTAAVDGSGVVVAGSYWNEVELAGRPTMCTPTNDVDALLVGFDGPAAPGGIEGTVTVDGHAAANAVVTVVGAYPSWRIVATLRTDRSGHYRIDGLPAAGYRLRVVDLAGYGERTWFPAAPLYADGGDLHVPAGEVVNADVGLAPRPLGTIAGHVTGPTGGAAPGVVVQVYRGQFGSYVAGTRVDASGAYRIGSLRPGSYVVKFVDPAGSLRTEFFDNVTNGLNAPTVAVGSGVVTADASLQTR